MFNPPSSPLDLLVNLKAALDADVLLRGDFYTDANLKALTGAGEVKWIENTTAHNSVRLLDFRPLINPVRIVNRTFQAIHYTIARRALPSGPTQVFVHLSLMESYPCLTFENITSVLGPGWNDYSIEMVSPGQILDAPTHPYGNKRIRYALNERNVDRSIVIELLANGHLYNAHISQESK